MNLTVPMRKEIFLRDRFNHASPNSAQTESVCAGSLRIRLAGDACISETCEEEIHWG